MSYILTYDGPAWEHIEGQWYQGSNGGKFLLCDKCAENWSIDNADFEFEGFEEGYRQTAGFLETCEPLPGDVCIQCERQHSATARDTSVTSHRLPILLALLAISCLAPACATQRHFVRQDFSNRHLLAPDHDASQDCHLVSTATQQQPASVYNFFQNRQVFYMRTVTQECYQCAGVTRCGPR